MSHDPNKTFTGIALVARGTYTSSGMLSLAFFLALGATAAEDTRTLAPASVKARFQPCIRVQPESIEEPPTLESLVQCHERFRIQWAKAYEREKGRPPAANRLDELVDLQK